MILLSENGVILETYTNNSREYKLEITSVKGAHYNKARLRMVLLWGVSLKCQDWATLS